MKKLLLFLLMMFLPLLANADAVEIDGIYYNLITKGNVAEVTNNPNEYTGSVVIPQTFNYNDVTYSVTNIGNDAFYRCSGLTSITIPNSVTSIGNSSFSHCTGLTSITIPNSITSIGENCFLGCSGLTSFVIPNSVNKIGAAAFAGCTGLTSITIPNSIEMIEHDLFGNCSNLTSITIPNSVIIIDNNAFDECSNLTSITIPNSVISIGKWAFAGCVSLKSVSIGNGIKEIYAFAFLNCPNLTDVICYSKNVPNTDINAFKDSYIEYATLHVPSASVNAYMVANPWKNFKNIVATDGETPATQKCEKPTISYENGQLVFTSATEGAKFISDITDSDIGKNYEAKVTLTATYNISVYATKTGYDNSDVATATLCWIDLEPKAEGITNGVASMRAYPVMIQSNGNVLLISGTEVGTPISVYDISGKLVGSVISELDTTHVFTTLSKGQVAIVKMGAKSVKIIMK